MRTITCNNNHQRYVKKYKRFNNSSAVQCDGSGEIRNFVRRHIRNNNNNNNNNNNKYLFGASIYMNIFRCALQVTQTHPTQPRGGHPSHSNLVRGKLTSPTPNPAGDGTSGLTSYPRRRSKVSEATCLRPQRSAPSRTRTQAFRPRVQRSVHWATHASYTCIA